MFVYTVCLICSLLVGQVFAAGRALPTVAYRNDGAEKFEYIYDSYGHIMSEKLYSKVDDSYELSQTTLFEYQQLPNGEFMKTKEECFDNLNAILIFRMTYSYDSKGMELSFKFEESLGGIRDWREAIVNAQGIRIGLKELNEDTGQLETSPYYAFDSKGRITQARGVIYTWGESLNELLSVNMENGITFTNIVPVKNLEYFNPYSLFPLDSGDEDSSSSFGGQFAWVDYRMHEMFANIDISMGELTGKYECTITDDVWTKKATVGDLVMEETVFTLLPNGGWEEVYTDENGDIDTTIREYDAHGFLTRDYSTGIRYNSDDEPVPYTYEIIYVREYDTQGRLTKTTKTLNGSLEYVDIYDSWTSSGINTPIVTVLSIYPTVTKGVVYIENPENEVVCVYAISGTQLFNVYSQSIDLSNYPNGLYFIKVGNRTAKIIKK